MILHTSSISTPDSTYIAKIAIQDLHIAMDDFKSDQFIVVLVDTGHKEQTCISCFQSLNEPSTISYM